MKVLIRGVLYSTDREPIVAIFDDNEAVALKELDISDAIAAGAPDDFDEELDALVEEAQTLEIHGTIAKIPE